MLSELASMPLTVHALAAIKPLATLQQSELLRLIDAEAAFAVEAIIRRRREEYEKQEGKNNGTR